MTETDRLAAYGLTAPEMLVCELARAVWRLLDFEAPLWRSAGPMVYQRYETRIRASAYQPTVVDWVWRLATKCHVSPQLIPLELIRRARALDRAEAVEALRVVREQPGLIVSAVRLLQDERKAARRAAAPPPET
jgi:hypothetical protein